MSKPFQSPWSLRMEELRQAQQRFDCTHKQTAIRTRDVAKGGKHYVPQCLRCGKATSNPMKRADAIYQNDSQLPPPFDEPLRAAWEDEQSQAFKAIDETYFERTSALSSGEFHADDLWQAQYELYLDTDKWKKKRALVLERDQQCCQGCMDAQGTEVHHLNYENMGDEFLFELVSLCHQCHEKIHERRKERMQARKLSA